MGVEDDGCIGVDVCHLGVGDETLVLVQVSVTWETGDVEPVGRAASERSNTVAIAASHQALKRCLSYCCNCLSLGSWRRESANHMLVTWELVTRLSLVASVSLGS